MPTIQDLGDSDYAVVQVRDHRGPDAADHARPRALREPGARLVVSTDAGVGPAKPHDAMAYAVLQFAAATGDPVGALKAATSRAADALGMGDTCGRIAPRRAADLLVVRGDAVTDLAALLEVQATYRNGEQVAAPSSRPRPRG